MQKPRNPKRKVPQGEDVIISPADGTVKNIKYVPYDGFIGEIFIGRGCFIL